MRLRRLHITGFGCLRERTITFGPGITLLLGPNEAGKSTVLACLAHMLMGKPSQRSAFADYAPRDGGEYAAMLEFDSGTAVYRLTRRFEASGARAALYRVREDGADVLVTREMGEVRKRLAGVLGTADDRVFYRTFCLTQADLHPLDNYAGLREHLERATSGAEVAVAAAITHLDERLASLRRGLGQPALPQNWGALKRAEEARREWETRLHEAKRQERRLADARNTMADVQQQLAEGNARREEIAALFDQDRQRQELLRRLGAVRESWSELEAARERVEKLQAERDRLQAGMASLPAVCAELPAVRRRLALVAQQSETSEMLGWTAALLGALAGAFTAFWQPVLAAVLFLVGALIGLPMLLRGRAGRRAREALCRDLAVENLSAAAERVDAAERLLREWEAIQLALGAVGEAEALEERRRTLALEMAMLEERLHAIPGTPLSAVEAHRMSQDDKRLQETLPSVQAHAQSLTREIAVLEEAERECIDLEDGVSYWREEEARAREEEQSLLLARELLLAAAERAHAVLTEPLAARIAPLLSQMTGGRYPAVHVRSDATAFQVLPLDASGQFVVPDQLSRGTYDQFVLAVRLALGQAIAGPQGTPIFLLDDPLLHFDETRRADALAMLQTLGQTTQIILATHDESLAEALPAATVIRMGDRPGMSPFAPSTDGVGPLAHASTP